MQSDTPGRPLRVLHVVPLLGHGGMETGVMKLVTGCDPSRIVSDVCTLEPARAFTDLFSGDSVLHELSRRSALDLGLVRALAAIMRRRAFDVVHTHAWGTLVEGRIAAKLAGVRHVIHGEHGTLETRPRNVRLQRHTWKRVDRLLAVSDELARRMVSVVGIDRARIDVIPNGVDLDLFTGDSRDAARRRLGLPLDATIVLAIGRLVDVKNYAMLLHAAALLPRTGPRWKVLIAGEGPLRADLEQRMTNLELDSVELLGHRTDTPDLLAACDVFALTSHSEGMSNTILEAMAAARPVVATRVGGNPELVREGVTGHLVTSNNAGQFAAALAALAASPERARAMGLAGREIAVSEFSIARMIDRYSAAVRRRGAGSGGMRFSVEDVRRFADWSADRNPLHVDEAFARQTYFGRPLVHGALAALDALSAAPLDRGVRALDIEFRGAVLAGEPYETGDAARRRRSPGHGERRRSGRPRHPRQPRRTGRRAAGHAGRGRRAPAGVRDVPLAHRIEEFEQGLDIHGVYPAACIGGARWNGLTPIQARVLALCSYVTGMETPGLKSLFTRITVTFYAAPPQLADLRYVARTVRFDRLFRLLDTELEVRDRVGSHRRDGAPAQLRPVQPARRGSGRTRPRDRAAHRAPRRQGRARRRRRPRPRSGTGRLAGARQCARLRQRAPR